MLVFLNFLLEAAALTGTWPLRVRWLRVFLVYLMVYDTVGVFVYSFNTGFLYWYFYWAGRTVGFLLLAVATIDVPCADSVVLARMQNRISWGLFGGLVTTVIWAWYKLLHHDVARFGHSSQLHMQQFSVVASILCGFIALLAVVFGSRMHLQVSGGLILWCLLAGVCGDFDKNTFAAVYPLACTAPLIVWSACYFVTRRHTRHDASIADRRPRFNETDDPHGRLQKFSKAI